MILAEAGMVVESDIEHKRLTLSRDYVGQQSRSAK